MPCGAPGRQCLPKPFHEKWALGNIRKPAVASWFAGCQIQAQFRVNVLEKHGLRGSLVEAPRLPESSPVPWAPSGAGGLAQQLSSERGPCQFWAAPLTLARPSSPPHPQHSLQICQSHKPCEIDPVRLRDGENLENNMVRHSLACSGASACPDGFRHSLLKCFMSLGFRAGWGPPGREIGGTVPASGE